MKYIMISPWNDIGDGIYINITHNIYSNTLANINTEFITITDTVWVTWGVMRTAIRSIIAHETN